MWRLGRHLVGQCVYLEKEISFIGVISAKVHAIYIGGKQVQCMDADLQYLNGFEFEYRFPQRISLLPPRRSIAHSLPR